MIEEKILEVTNYELNNLPTTFINEWYDVLKINHEPGYFHFESGREHYRLLMYISILYSNEIIFDVGTNKCMSALSLSYNKQNKVKTFDVIKVLPENPKVDNIEYVIGDATTDKSIKNTPFIFLDVDHDGLYEKKIYDYLISINWKGLLLLDDIHLNTPMKDFWNKISKKKYDITHIGHWSGTGLVVFQ